jgi:hypothetical protein
MLIRIHNIMIPHEILITSFRALSKWNFRARRNRSKNSSSMGHESVSTPIKIDINFYKKISVAWLTFSMQAVHKDGVGDTQH